MEEQNDQLIEKGRRLQVPKGVREELASALLKANMGAEDYRGVMRVLEDQSKAASQERLLLHLIALLLTKLGGSVVISPEEHKVYTDEVIKPREGDPPDMLYGERKKGGLSLSLLDE